MDTNANYSNIRWNRPGTKASDYDKFPELEFKDMNGMFALQVHIKQMVKTDPKQVEKILSKPDSVGASVWKYHHLCQFCAELNLLVVMLQKFCVAERCPKMKASDGWIFLCAAHPTPRECAAIDYIRHTLDKASALLHDEKLFPLRLPISDLSLHKMQSLTRRIYRIFAHAHYHHPEVFEEFESRTFLFCRFSHFLENAELIAVGHPKFPISFEFGESDA